MYSTSYSHFSGNNYKFLLKVTVIDLGKLIYTKDTTLLLVIESQPWSVDTYHWKDSKLIAKAGFMKKSTVGHSKIY